MFGAWRSPVSAPGLGPGGRRFESCRPDISYFVYILYSTSINKFYCGQTNNLENRIVRHNSGQSKWTTKGIPWELVWSRSFDSRSESVKQERIIKKRGIQRYLEDIGHFGV